MCILIQVRLLLFEFVWLQKWKLFCFCVIQISVSQPTGRDPTMGREGFQTGRG